jgi:predicted transcriptional regulator
MPENESLSITVRMSAALVASLDALAQSMSADPMLSPRGKATRADALRLAVTRGLQELEADARRPRR